MIFIFSEFLLKSTRKKTWPEWNAFFRLCVVLAWGMFLLTTFSRVFFEKHRSCKHLGDLYFVHYVFSYYKVL